LCTEKVDKPVDNRTGNWPKPMIRMKRNMRSKS
jgi:hypothetical protein